MTVTVFWRILKEKDPVWYRSGCLYAYLTPKEDEILYIGKAWRTTVKDRWSRTGKRGFWEDLEKRRGIKHHIPLIGIIYLSETQRLTRELLADIESLLISIEKPWGNIKRRHTRTQRPGMTVKCIGSWPGAKQTYKDKG